LSGKVIGLSKKSSTELPVFSKMIVSRAEDSGKNRFGLDLTGERKPPPSPAQEWGAIPPNASNPGPF
jgi:hypothetical protein